MAKRKEKNTVACETWSEFKGKNFVALKVLNICIIHLDGLL
jgi:hypothetical protein